MIGYIRIYKPELKYREFLVYNAYYCGICKALGDRYGLVYRNFINYDAVFIALLLDSAHGFEASFETFRCILHPTKKKHRCTSSESINFAADLTVLLTRAKLRDNILDDNDLLAKIGQFFLKRGFDISSKILVELVEEIEKELRNLHVFEKENSSNVDLVSGCYGNIIKIILEYGAGESDIKMQLGWIGFHLGKWVYIADAWTDIENDIKKKSYNPLLKRFNYNEGDIAEFKDSIRERTEFMLFASLDEISSSFEQIDKKINSGIIRNILYEGLYNMTDNILNGVTQKNASKESI
ncbi:MAG: hypothetical protein JXN10_11800 [Clostridia bacterium]|nr:hypothetical protein [Clostridia bacterium]MBN2884205.1 hypothetical protein [Clostridia bacterium]